MFLISNNSFVVKSPLLLSSNLISGSNQNLHDVMLALSEPQDGQHHDLYKIKALFAELCGLLKEADIDCRGVFLNAGPGSRSNELRPACIEKEIEANIKPNLRNKDKYEGGYFDEELYNIKEERARGMQMPGWTGLRDWLLGMNPG